MATRDLIVCSALAAVAVYVLAVCVNSPPGSPSYDMFMYYLPNMLYAAQRVHAGGTGLLWNAWQNLGQPALGISSTGMLYPANVAFLFLDPDWALRAVGVFNFTVAGVSAYALCRELGTTRTAAFCGAIAFELGTGVVDLNTWGPHMGGAFVWLPAAMLFCERLLRAPTFRSIVGLAVALALPLLTGFPQSVFYAYQLIALRTLFELLTRRVTRPFATLGAVGAGLLLAPLLIAVQLLPAIEMARFSVRAGSLSLQEIMFEAKGGWKELRMRLASRYEIGNPFVVVPTIAAAAFWVGSETRRVGLFYFLSGSLYVALASAASTPLFGWYVQLPLGAVFRTPLRFLWITSFCLAVLTALGVDALVSWPRTGLYQRWAPALGMLAGLGGLWWLLPNGLSPSEWLLGGLLIAASLGAAVAWRPRAVSGAVAALAIVLGAMLFASPMLPWPLSSLETRPVPFRRLVDGSNLFAYRDLYARLGAAITPQDRVFILYKNGQFSLMPKSASLFALPSVQDYEPQAARRYAAYLTMLRMGQRLTTLNQFYYPAHSNVAAGFRKPLLDLAAGRYAIIDGPVDNTQTAVKPPFDRFDASGDGRVTVYENRQALPRAFFVPRAQVEPNAEALLEALARGHIDPRATALLEAPPPTGFLGETQGQVGGEAEFLINEPERLVLRVRAPLHGFLHLADQYFPGWSATVDGVTTPILRANYLFRAVEVPAGESTVEFVYAPSNVYLGAAISATTIVGLVALALVRARRRAAPA